METPVLTKKQQKSSLLAKKTKTKETIRNVISSPYVKYWPLISPNDSASLKTCLGEFLPKLLPNKVKIDWKILKDVPKAERKRLREEFSHKMLGTNQQEETSGREGLRLGINDVTKALENCLAKSVLITQDVHPKLMVEHVIDLSVLHKIPVLVVPHLRTILKEKCGISSVVIAFTNCEKFRLVQDSIRNIFERYPEPKNHINFERAMDSQIKFIEKERLAIEKKNKNFIKNSNVIDENRDSVYLIRTSKDTRAFVPEKSSNEVKRNDKMEVDSTGFLSFSTETNSDFPDKKYASLKIKRIKGDKKRNKRKIDDLKLKSSKKRRKRFKKGGT